MIDEHDKIDKDSFKIIDLTKVKRYVNRYAFFYQVKLVVNLQKSKTKSDTGGI